RGRTEPIAMAEPRDARRGRDVLERPIATVAKQPVASIGSGRFGPRGERAALHEIDIEPAVTIVVEHGDTPADGLGDLMLRRCTVLIGEAEPGRLGIVAKRDHGS